MSNYIDGFAFPIPNDRLGDYRSLADSVAAIWKEHGALAYHEYLGDDMALEGTRSFVDALSVGADEAVIFGWVTFESRQVRDRVNERVASDPRMDALMSSFGAGFDARRMTYGGFRALVLSQDPDSSG